MSKNNIHVLSRAVVIDQDHILLCKTLDLTLNFYFLPGGHVEHGESAENAVTRELQEEAGALACVKKFLGCLEHSFIPGQNSICHNHEYNLVFKVESETLKKHIAIPKLESHIELIWMPLNILHDIDFRAEAFKTLIPQWLELNSQQTFISKMI